MIAVFDVVLTVLITAVPFAFLLGLMRSTLSRAGAVSALFERLGGVSARDALAEALGDDTLTLAYWLPDQRRYVDAQGRTVALEGAVTEIERDGTPIAAIVHDPALLEERELVRTAGAAAALALENERLAAEVRARYDELQAVSARLVAAGDAARRKIERDLHDGAQQRLVSLSVTLNLARKNVEPGSQVAELLDSAMSELTAGLAELRELARGIHPAVLTERGLDPALQSLAARAPLPVSVSASVEGRFAPAVEAAVYFVVMEALTNIAKYASASAAEVTVEQVDGQVVIDVQDDGIGGADPASGTGLAGLADRVAALGGRLVVESPPGGGTVVRAEVPARRSERRYLSEVKLRSQVAALRLTTPLTSAERSIGCVSHSHGIAAASSVIALSISPHALLRSAGSLITSASSICLLMSGSSSRAKFEFPSSRMFLPLNTGPSSVSGSAKSFSQPTLGQTSGWLPGTWQNFVYIESRTTYFMSILKPSFSNCATATCVTFFCCVALSDTPVSCSPSYMPDS